MLALTLARYWRVLLAAGTGLALLLWLTMAAWQHGVAHERLRWQARWTAAEAARRRLEINAQQVVEAAATARAERDRAYGQRRAPITNEVIRYAKSPVARVACPDADGLRLGRAAIAAANSALAAR